MGSLEDSPAGDRADGSTVRSRARREGREAPATAGSCRASRRRAVPATYHLG